MIAVALEQAQLPEGMRFFIYEGQTVFRSLEGRKYIMQLIIAPKEISDYELKISDIKDSEDVIIEESEITHKSYREVCMLLQTRIAAAVEKLQERNK